MKLRIESDFLGELEVPENALYGVHSLRATQNFPWKAPFNLNWYKAIGLVKKACYLMTEDLRRELAHSGIDDSPVRIPDETTLSFLATASGEVAKGLYYEHFIVSAVSGGAGTSINMNVNEIIANVALIKGGFHPGDYERIDPVEDANVFQSTNDVIPTALKLAVMQLLNELEESINGLRGAVEQHENRHRHNLRPGFTQMQEAVPTSWGKLFSTYSEALSRDWWRVSKCFERIKVVNLGGGAIGTGLAIPRYFMMHVVQKLQHLTGLPVTRSENLPDTTANLDSLVEVHGILKAHAVNLEKMVSDLRLLASDVSGRHGLRLPPRQVGSSIMPGKVNPVIPEYVISVAHKIYANDQLITGLAAQGCLELNAYLPVIGDALLADIEMLIACNHTLAIHLFEGLSLEPSASLDALLSAPSISTALVPLCGYKNAAKLAAYMIAEHCDVFTANAALSLLAEKKLKETLEPGNLLKLGFSFREI